MNYYKNKVAWCPICDQGWVEIVKDVVTNDLFVYCNECESEWNQPSEVNSLNDRTELTIIELLHQQMKRFEVSIGRNI
ncbi:hypothetical protein [Gottfriedia acidiceleris]|uniref:Uncharacterized protein n=1 Tax=Gottfriedia acidiceleris TaxID=371036 RepID=A0ABY4JPP1_9BACI|nr:hypothetical protein [Gottfriedia acidiceleris]UPM54803.1 hypothetical protein MY490_02720 [Gottfriedia acidiceleris]